MSHLILTKPIISIYREERLLLKNSQLLKPNTYLFRFLLDSYHV